MRFQLIEWAANELVSDNNIDWTYQIINYMENESLMIEFTNLIINKGSKVVIVSDWSY